jgi:hypothetical protein
MTETSQYLRLFAETIPRTLRQTVIILVRTRDIPGSDLGKESWYLDPVFRGFSQSLQANAGIVN